MPPKRLSRTEQRSQTRERLLSAAEKVVARHGYGGASIDLISAEAGYSKGAIYSNFDGKDAVLLELLGVYMEREMREFEHAMDVAPDKLSEASGRWLTSLQTNEDCLLLTVELQLQARRSASFAERYYALQERQIRALAAILKRVFKASGSPLPVPATDLAGALIAIAHGLALQRPQSLSDTPGKVVDAMLKLMLRL